MMPSLAKKQQAMMEAKKNNKFIKAGFPKGIIIEIALYLSNNFKAAARFMRTCKTFYEQCSKTPRFWYYLYVQRFPKEFLKQYYIKLAGESSS